MWWWLTVPVGLVLFDRLAVWAERRGWIYWRHRPGSGAGAGALGELIDVFQPSHRVVVEERRAREVRVGEVGSGGPRELAPEP